MQSIWLRVAQAQACYCRACSRATATLTNQTTTSARSQRRQGTTSSNVSRIRLMATTATDAPTLTTTEPKLIRTEDLTVPCMEDRDQKLDRDQAWEGLAKLIARPTRHRSSTPRQTNRAPAAIQKNRRGLYNTLAIICENPKTLEMRKGRKNVRKDDIDRLRKWVYGSSKESKWWKTPSTRVDELADCVTSEETERWFKNRDPLRPVHAEKYHEMINGLVDKLLVEAYKDEQGNSTTPDLLSSAWNQVRMLRSDGYPKYRPESHDRLAAADSRAKLNQINRNILRDWGVLRQHVAGLAKKSTLRPWDLENYKKKREYFIGKICHNLLVVEYVPGIQNYNVLMAGLLQIGEHDLARLVVKSYDDDSRLKPSPMTMVTMLHYYRTTRKVLGFYEFLKRLTGQDPRGVGLRRRTVADVENNKYALKWAQHADVAMVEGQLVQIPLISKPLVEAILDGLIDFEQPRQAAAVLVACLREGIDVDSEYLHRVVGLCNSHLDRIAALILVKELFPKVDEFSALVTASMPADFHQLVRLLNIGDSNAERNLIVPAEESQWIKFDDETDWNFRLACLIRAMDTALILARIQDVQKWADNFTAYLLSKPDIDDPTIHYHHRELRAVLQKHNRIEANVRTFKSLVRLEWITELYRISQQKLHAYDSQFSEILVKSIPPKHRPFAVFNSDIALEERLHIIREIKKSLPWLRQADDCFHKARELEQSMKWTLCNNLPQEQQEGLIKLDENERPRFTFREALAEWKAYLTRLEERDGSGHCNTARDPSTELRSQQAPALATRTGQGRPVATEATDMFTAAILEKRFTPSS